MDVIKFTKISKEHFPYLLNWLNEPHVSRWYDPEIQWDIKKIEDKYNSYTQGFKLESGIKKSINAFVVHYENNPIGYIQYYNAYDFPREEGELINLPKSLASLDLFIGDKKYIGKGIGSQILTSFMDKYIFKEFDYIYIDVEPANMAAIKCYEKSGFTINNESNAGSNIAMLTSKKEINLIESLEKKLLEPLTRKSKDSLDKLISDNFVEFSKSGKIYNKQDVLSSLPNDPGKDFIAKNFETTSLAAGVYLVTYKTVEEAGEVLRSSIWHKIQDSWFMVFHQGTKAT